MQPFHECSTEPRSGRPYKSTIDKIAKAIDDPELPIQELYDATGYSSKENTGTKKDNCRQWILWISLLFRCMKIFSP